ncbi:unnamed protein product, partial [Closterium sp. NIES-53]
TCGKAHTQHRCFSHLDDAWRAEFGDEVERPHWAEPHRSGVAISDLDYDAILSAMYALFAIAEGDCYRYVPPDPGIEAAALGASESSLPGTAPAEALHTFTLVSGASLCFFCDSTTLTPLPAPVPVRLADPSGGPVVARSPTVLPCPAVPSGSLLGLHLPSFSTNLVSIAALKDAMVTTTTPGGQRVSICTCTLTGRHLATFTRRPESSMYTLTTEPPQVATSAQVSASVQVAPPCSCRLLLHQTLLWHHRLGHPSLPCLRGMHSRLLVSGLPRTLPPLPPSPAPPCLPCVEGRQRVAPHSSSFPPTTAPLQTLHMDVWGPARVSGQGHERYFLLVVDDYTQCTTVFPLRSKDRGGKFSSDLLRDFCRGEGILQSFMLPDSPQQNGIAERRIGLVMEPRVSFTETSPTLCWTVKVGDESVFRVWGSHAFVRDTSADKLSARGIPCFFLGFTPDAPGWQFYHLSSRRVFPSQDVTFDEGAASGGAEPGVSESKGAGSGGVESEGAASRGAESEGAGAGGAASRGEEPGGAEPAGVEPGGAEPEGVEPGGADSEGAESGAARAGGAGVTARAGGTRGTASAGPGGACTRGTEAAGTCGVGGAGAGDPTEPGAARARGSCAGGAGAGGDGTGGTGAGGAGAGGAGARGTDAGGVGAGGAGVGGTGAGGARA